MKIRSGTLAKVLWGVVVLSLPAFDLDAQLDQAVLGVDSAPEPINLDIPPEEPPDPAFEQQKDSARAAIADPQSFHERLLQLEPGRRGLEQLGLLAILYPEEFSRAHPKNPEQTRAEAIARHAILNPHIPQQSPLR
jgi:hypothetical protein